MTWANAAMWAIQVLQLWQAGEQEVDLKTIERALGILKDEAGNGDVIEAKYEGDPGYRGPRSGSADWIEEQEHLENELAATDGCCCW